MAFNEHALSMVTPSSISWLSNGQSISRLQMKKIKCSHTWTIENFSFCPHRNGERLRSPDFYDEPDSRLKWYLVVYPNGSDEEAEGYVSLFLCFTTSYDTFPVFAKFEISLLTSNATFVEARSWEYLFVNQDYTGYGDHNFLERSFLFNEDNGLLHNDELTIHCEVVAAFESAFALNPDRPFSVKRNEFQSSQNLALYLESGTFSDVTLRMQGKEIHAHKVILAANSPVFSAMFKHDMKEKSSDIVYIDDFDSEAMEALIAFLYTAKEPVLDFEKAKSVLGASDKYAIESVKSICEDFLVSKLNVRTAADLLYLADMHNAEDLKRCSLNFIRDHAAGVLNTQSWKSLVNSRPQLLLEAFEKVTVH